MKDTMEYNKIICADVLDGLKLLPDNSVSLICTSPPYAAGSGVQYDNRDDNQPYREYLDWLETVFSECKRVLRTGGRLAINIDSVTNREKDKDQEYFRPIYVDLGNMMRRHEMKFFAEHVWLKGATHPFHGVCPECQKTISVNGLNFCGKKTAWGS